MADRRLPRGALADATRAIIAAAGDFGPGNGHRVVVAGPAEDLARAALEAALPAIERAAQRETARHILALDAEDAGRRRQPGHHNKGPWNDMQTSLRRLTRGESLPEVPGA